MTKSLETQTLNKNTSTWIKNTSSTCIRQSVTWSIWTCLPPGPEGALFQHSVEAPVLRSELFKDLRSAVQAPFIRAHHLKTCGAGAVSLPHVCPQAGVSYSLSQHGRAKRSSHQSAGRQHRSRFEHGRRSAVQRGTGKENIARPVTCCPIFESAFTSCVYRTFPSRTLLHW